LSISAADWTGVVLNQSGTSIPAAKVELRSQTTTKSAVTGADGAFRLDGLEAGTYTLTITVDGKIVDGPREIELQTGVPLTFTVASESRSGGEDLSAKAVSSIPLNKRDFSQLLLLAAGTMTDSNGATNFTQQFAINGQRGVEAVFAMDSADSSDPELGGATFSNFNVDAVQEIQSSSGWMPAEIGRGAAGFTNIITRSGAAGFHGSVFEFVRNSAFDARNFFDRQSIASPGRIPPFRRNEFGFTNGGALVPGKTFYFIEYQGFRQVLGTTQVFPVPTAAQRQGIDTTAFPGDTLYVPVDPRIARLIDRYPLPNNNAGPYGVNTYATSSKVSTDADQFSIRLDHKLTGQSQLFARFSADNLSGPTTNPDQTAVDPSFGVRYIDHQRNAVLTYTHGLWDSSISFTRTTPSFPTPNKTDPGLTYGDGLFEAFNSAAGSVMRCFGNLFVGRQTFTWLKGKHAIKAGGEFRANRDTTYFGIGINGSYVFGGGTSYAPVAIRSLSGAHNIAEGAPLPDTLSALLTASPFSYTVAVAPPQFPQGDQIGVAAISRYAVNFFVQDTWKISKRLVLDYGLRYEVYWPITERAKRTAAIEGNDYLINPQPGYQFNLNGFGPRVRLSYQAAKKVEVTVGASITTIPPNIWQDNFLTGSAPYVIYPRITAGPGSPIQFGVPITPAQLPGIYTTTGANIFATGSSSAVPPNTVWDVNRFEQSLAALNPSHQISAINTNSIDQAFGNGYLGAWNLGLERHYAQLDGNVAYIGTAGVHLPAVNFPNGYPGATAAFAPYTQFDAAGNVTGGFGTESLLTDRSRSTYHALQSSLQGNAGKSGPLIQVSYTFSKSLDDTSSVLGGFIAGASGASQQAWPQNPFDTRAEKGPSTFDVKNAFSASVIQDLHAEKLALLKAVSSKATNGWQLLSIATLTSGLPFTVYSGVQQTGAGTNGVDRPDQIGTPVLSTSRTIREDYFGMGANNASYFSIPIGVAGGTGPNQGVFGTLGRDTFRGPAFHDFDFAVIKDTAFGERGTGELVNLQFRAEFFNLFNIVNFGLPANIIKGSGFGEISRTASNSRQIQFSLKLIF
jgi:hypothetical protein